MPHWSLYVDESGGFKRHQGSLVAGLLVPARAKELDSPSLRRRFEQIWGPAPFPPHAAIYRDPMGQALLAAIKPDERAMPSGKHAGARRQASRRVLGLLEGTSFAGRLEQLREGRNTWLRLEDVWSATSLLRSIPGTAADIERLVDVAELQRASMDTLVRKALSQYPGTRVLLVRGDHDTDGAPIPGTRLLRDRYVDALETMLLRLHRILGANDTCELHVLTRDVEVTGIGAGRSTVHFGGLLLKELVETVRGQTASAAQCRAGSATQHYRDRADVNESLHPFLVLADWVATTCRPATRDPVTTLADLERHLEAMFLPRGSLRAPVLTPALGVLPLLGAAGLAEDRIRSALTRIAEPPVAPTSPRWVVDQCSEWVDAAKRGAA